jgi:hypothetical protein
MNVTNLETTTDPQAAGVSSELSPVVINLLKGVVYRDDNPAGWSQLLTLQAAIHDYVAVLGLELILDEAEGYAFLRSKSPGDQDADDGEQTSPSRNIPRLVARRPLSFPVSLLLALLRKKLAEFDAGGGDTRLVLSREQIVELVRVFLPESSNEARLVDQIDRHINRIVEMGFLRRLKTGNTAPGQDYEVRRILKAFVDAQWLAGFDEKLAQYLKHLSDTTETGDDRHE